jgi:hypothetical protein
MSGHPADEAFLDALVFKVSSTRGHCDRCSHPAPTVVIGYVETGSGGGYDVRHCRGCVGIYLARARAEQCGAAFQPALPPW